jgi:hypothetical protein
MAFRVSSGARKSGASGKGCRRQDGRPALPTLRFPALQFRSLQSFAVREPASLIRSRSPSGSAKAWLQLEGTAGGACAGVSAIRTPTGT